MSQDVLTTETNRREVQQVIAGLTNGVILLELDPTILWANGAALAMHGVGQISELGANAKEYAKRFFALETVADREPHGLLSSPFKKSPTACHRHVHLRPTAVRI